MFCENLAGNILSHIYNDTTPFLFLPKRCGLEYPLKWNCETGKVSSSLISVMIKISNIPFTRTFSSVNFLVKESMLALFRMGFFGAAHGWGGGGAKKPPSLKSATHILQWWNLAHLYLTPWVPLTSTIFHRKSANFAISRNTCIGCIFKQNF